MKLYWHAEINSQQLVVISLYESRICVKLYFLVIGWLVKCHYLKVFTLYVSYCIPAHNSRISLSRNGPVNMMCYQLTEVDCQVIRPQSESICEIHQNKLFQSRDPPPANITLLLEASDLLASYTVDSLWHLGKSMAWQMLVVQRAGGGETLY